MDTGLPSGLVAFALSEQGSALLTEAAAMPPDRLTRLTRLRKRCAPERAAYLVELLELRHRARAKFADAEAMFFTDEGLQQSTGETIAVYRAARFPAGVPIFDVCCGIGGDARALRQRGPVVALDASPLHAACAHANTSLRPANTCPPFPVHIVCQDARALNLDRLRQHGMEAAFFDPSRRRDNRHGQRQRAADPDDYSPPLDWLRELTARFPSCAVKLGPALPDEIYRRYDTPVEFLSEDGECKEAVLWFGALAAPLEETRQAAEPYAATVLRRGQPPATLLPFAIAPNVRETAPPRGWLYEPDPAVIRAHLVGQVAALLAARPLAPDIAYLTAEAFTPSPFATGYRILDVLPFQEKAVQKRLRALERRVIAIKKRGVPLEPHALQTRLTGVPDAQAPAIVVLTRSGDKIIALICEPPAHPA